MLLNSSKLIAKWTARYSGICFVFGELGGPVSGRKRRDDADNRLPFGDRQAGQGKPRDAADHHHQKNHPAADEQPGGDHVKAISRVGPCRLFCRRDVQKN